MVGRMTYKMGVVELFREIQQEHGRNSSVADLFNPLRFNVVGVQLAGLNPQGSWESQGALFSTAVARICLFAPDAQDFDTEIRPRQS